jgi:hypothetical protein
MKNNNSHKQQIQYDDDEDEVGPLEYIPTTKKGEMKVISEIPLDNKKAKKHVKLEIQGIEVYFPYKPYKVQVDYMEKGINA